jgi:hypothetical protein
VKTHSLRYWLNWTFACGIGEFLGIGAAAGIAVLHRVLLGEPDDIGEGILAILIMVIAGVIEGTITGLFQWKVLRRKFERLPAKSWVGFTIAGAAVGWLLGMIPSTFLGNQPATSSVPMPEFSAAQVALFAALLGIVLGAIFGTFQWIALRKHTLKASRWILANLLGWVPGLAFIFVGASIPTAETGLAVIVILGLASGLLGGLSVGAVTGLFLVRMQNK